MANELNEAVLTGDCARVDELIAAGADVNAKGNLGRTAAHCVGIHWTVPADPAEQDADRAILRALLNAGADLAARNIVGTTPEIQIAQEPHLVEELAKWRIGRYTKPARASRR